MNGHCGGCCGRGDLSNIPRPLPITSPFESQVTYPHLISICCRGCEWSHSNLRKNFGILSWAGFPMSDDDLKERVVETLNETVAQDNVRTSVLVLGEGINIQASRVRERGTKDSWNGIMRSLWITTGGDPTGFDHLRSSALQWTCLIELYARRKNISLSSAEKILQTTICKHLKQVEAKRQESETLYAEILNASFANIVWFNM